ncbi:DNA polymerase I [Campylobacter suis]|uniref:DNA polymerase I n=1 Tax=Campylobacter suis TaxID=2790657 RepID=A0ABN7K2W9_9BACT|nr:DNA polymerase I [Campylobacter suis]CAD7286380.1 DNA polymerase I [Campylobacter suis]
MKTLTIIDTFGFFFRLYYAMSGLKNKDGKPSGMVSGFANFILNLKEEYQSDYIIFALDSKGKTLRHELAGEYKANRSEPPAELKAQLPVCIKMIEKMGLCAISREGYEADDIIASVVKECKKEGIFTRIVTHDKDLYQLIEDGKVSIYSPQSKVEHDTQSCIEKYGVKPEFIRDYLALTGDSSDNIPGVKGIGSKGAKKLIDEFGGIEQIYENLALISNERVRNMLIDGRDSAFLSKKLATLFDNIDVKKELSKAEFPQTNPLLNIIEILREYDLNRILKHIENDAKSENISLGFGPVLLTKKDELETLLSDITNQTIVAFDTETTSIDAQSAKIVGFSFCFNEQKAYYVPIAHNYLGVGEQIEQSVAKWAIEQIFKGCVVGQNLKYDLQIVAKNYGIKPPKNLKDTMILAWLSEPGTAVGMDALAKRLYNYETIKFEDVVKKGETFANVALENAVKYAAEDAWITLKFYNTFLNTLDKELLQVADKLEFDFVKTLFEVESNGIKLDTKKMSELLNSLNSRLKTLSGEIYELSGESFNINSVKQLGEVLFERLKLPVKKKTKTGYSTDESVLNELINEHPVIEKLLEYRELYKLVSTYCEPLLSLARKDESSRIYTSFLQTGTSTGRLSSKNPNLQNIPARGRLAKDVRSAFIARDGFSLVGLDYSQIELRLLAHFSRDTALLDAFKNDEDIHTRTAISIFGSTDEQKRAVAKSINFGLIYGMGANKLSDQIDISRAEAKEYIERYFRAFPSIKGFLESLKISAKNDGFITTLIGRKRFFNFSNASPMQVAMQEREAVNTKFQGSAADLIKMAMVKISAITDERAKMLLQIHDELIFEVKDEYAQEFAEHARQIMQNIYTLNVPLKCSLNIAKNWGELK